MIQKIRAGKRWAMCQVHLTSALWVLLTFLTFPQLIVHHPQDPCGSCQWLHFATR